MKEGKPSSIKARDGETVKLERSNAFDIWKVKLMRGCNFITISKKRISNIQPKKELKEVLLIFLCCTLKYLSEKKLCEIRQQYYFKRCYCTYCHYYNCYYPHPLD